jgi:hypothetical protein
MNNNEQEIESLLRQSPRPRPPTGLKAKLLSQVQPSRKRAEQKETDMSMSQSWLRRWWPVFAPATVSLMCVVVMAVQHAEISGLKRSLQTLSHAASPEMDEKAEVVTSQRRAVPIDSATREQQEIGRLQELAKEMTTDIARLEQIKAENVTLQSQLSSPTSEFTPEELDVLKEEKEKANSMVCINHMKQLGLSARVWAQDNGHVMPPTILAMTNEMNTPKILRCPSDTGRTQAPTFSDFSSVNSSYDYLAPGESEVQVDRVLFRCRIHGHISLVDGSVQAGIKEHPEWIVERDGKLYFKSR